MKKSTIITVLAFALGLVLLTGLFIACTDNNISDKLFPTTTTTTSTTTTTGGASSQRPQVDPMNFFKEDVSKFITLGQYKGLDIEVDQLEISQEEIDQQIMILLCQDEEYTKLREGVITEKIPFSFDYTGYLLKEDGTRGDKFDGGSSTNQLALIDGDTLITISSSGTGSFIDGFAQGIIGKSVGDTFEINITFPEDYHADMAGKKTVFEIKLNFIAQTNFTDGWVKEYTDGKYETCDELVQYIKDNSNSQINQTNTQTVWAQITKNVTVVELPQQQLDYIYNSLMSEIEGYAAYSQYYFGKQMTVDEVLAYFGFTSDEDLKEYAKDIVKNDLVAYAVMQAENMTVTDEEYKALLAELVELSGKTEDEVIKTYGGEESIKESMLLDKVDKFVLKENNLILKTAE